MAFDLGNGLSAAGTAVAATAGAYTLEAQKADAQKEMVMLADQLAGAREEKGRAFTTSERVATQGFTSGENVLNRTNAKDIAQLSADAAVKSAGIHAGATIAAANIGATTAANQLAQNKPLIDAEALSKTIANTNAQSVVDARKELDDATAKGDATAVQAAKLKVYNAEYSGKDEVAKVSLYQAQAKLLESALSQAQTRLVQLQDPMKSQSPGAQEQAALLEKQVKQLTSDFNTAVRTANEAVKGLPSYTPPGATAGTGGAAPDLNKYLRTTPAAPVTGAPAGLINSTPPQ